MDAEDIELLAKEIVKEQTELGIHTCNVFSNDQVKALESIVATKKWAVKATLLVTTGILIWTFKSSVVWLLNHLKWS